MNSEVDLSKPDDLPIALLDSDPAGKQFKQGLKQGRYKGAQDKLLETDTFTGKIGSEIEDLIPPNLIVDSFNELFTSMEALKVGNIKADQPIIPQLERFAKDNQINIGVNWKVRLSDQVIKNFNPDMLGDFEDKWVALIERCNRK